jgi:riboflavin kinase/FMN adenylyltransferase
LELITELPARLRVETAVALGFFDGVHLGHRAVLAAAQEQGLSPIAFTFSTALRAPGGKAGGRIYTDKQRVQLLGECGVQTVVMPDFSEIADMAPEAFADFLCSGLRARLVACGEDYRFSAGARADALQLRRLCEERGCRVKIVLPVLAEGDRVSSTCIRQLLREGKIERANRLLGAPYRIEERVEHGRRLGRTLGFPTLNQPLPEEGALPLYGVYASRAWIEGRWQEGITNIGVRPTVSRSFSPRAETFLIGYSGDLYGKAVQVQLLGFLRPERRFDDIEALRAQILADCRAREDWQPAGW